jgi:integrase
MPGEAALVFPAWKEEPWDDEDWRNWRRHIFAPAAKAAGLARFRPYDLRHSFVSLLIAEGRGVVEVASRPAIHRP